jgi:hypothetical protein
MAVVGALRRCPPLASHPARTTSISTIYSWWVLNPLIEQVIFSLLADRYHATCHAGQVYGFAPSDEAPRRLANTLRSGSIVTACPPAQQKLLSHAPAFSPPAASAAHNLPRHLTGDCLTSLHRVPSGAAFLAYAGGATLARSPQVR